QIELGRPRDALTTLRRFEDLTPLREKETNDWLTARRADAAGHAAEWRQAAEFARQVDVPHYQRFAVRCEEAGAEASPQKPQRRLLPVGFVRQHNMTCAPATLSALSQFWKKPAEHLAVAEEI